MRDKFPSFIIKYYDSYKAPGYYFITKVEDFFQNFSLREPSYILNEIEFKKFYENLAEKNFYFESFEYNNILPYNIKINAKIKERKISERYWEICKEEIKNTEYNVFIADEECVSSDLSMPNKETIESKRIVRFINNYFKHYKNDIEKIPDLIFPCPVCGEKHNNLNGKKVLTCKNCGALYR